MKSSRRVVIAAIGLAAVMVLSACGQATSTPTATSPTSTTATSKPTSTPTATTPKGPYGELKVAIATFGAEKLDPVIAAGTDKGQIDSLLYDGLTGIRGPDVVAKVAEKWEMAPDGLSWTFYIHKGVKFHNGEDLKADDVKFSLDRFASKESYEGWLRDAVERVEIVDDYTVRVFTKGTQPYLTYFTDTYYTTGLIMPKDYFEKNGKDYFGANPVGSGPWKYVSRVPGDTLSFEAVPNHYRVTPGFKNLTLILMPEESTRVASLKTSAVDIIDLGLESAIGLEKDGFRTAVTTVSGNNLYFFGTFEPKWAGQPTADVRVRQALSLAINREEIRQTFFYGKAGPPTPPLLTENSADIDAKYWMDYAAQVYRYDPEESKRLLNEAGYPNGFSGIKIYGYSMSGAPHLARLGEVVQGYWQKVGVKAEVVPIDYGTFNKWRVGSPDQPTVPEIMGQTSIHSNSFRPVTPMQLVRGFGSRATKVLGNSMPELDALMDASAKEMDPAKRKDMVARAMKMIMDTYTCLVIVSAPDMCALGPRVDLDFPSSSPYMNINLERAQHRQ